MNNADHIKKLEAELIELEAQNRQLQQRLAHEPPSAAAAFDWRKLLSRSFLVLSLLALIPAGLLIWLNRTVMDPNGYIKTVGPVIQQPQVQQALTANASNALFSSVHVEQAVAQALPSQAQFLATPIASQVETQTTNAIGRIVASQKFYDVWISVNQKAQAAFVQVAQSGRSSPTIDVHDVYGFISDQLQNTKLAPLLNKQLPSQIGNIQVASVPALVQIPHIVSVLNTWRWVLGVAFVVFAALAVWLARDRRRGIMNVGGVLLLASVLSLVLVRIVRGLMLAQVANPTNHEAAIVIWQTVLHYFYVQLGVLAVAGIAMMAVGWLLGPSGLALRWRQGGGSFLATTRTKLAPGLGNNSVVAFMQQHRHYFEWGVLGLTILALLAFIPLSVGTIILILVLACVVLLGVEFVVYPAAGS